MTDFIKILTRKNSLRKQCNENKLSVADLDKVIADLNDIRAEIETEALRQAEQEQMKQQQVEEIQRLMKEAGIGLNELKQGAEPVARKSVKAKYVIVDSEGQEHSWSGRGRTPIIFREYMEKNGLSKEQLPTVE
ncbi:H-NS histone family protein [Marinobacterium marinum]|uniref:H-NS histone family protein n=1 Tax=Marinobacterium marinum TaxID=2756129 RepID=A0A7W1WYQ7_9GAMM|nr:H-NS histone family protein [Marinobacterium marinum]MBA4502507.1 H-NS histone family protein [Marinobacterium marinum]